MLTGLGPHESSLLRVDPSGKVALVTGASPHGQGTATALAQIVADELGISPGDVSVAHGDTDAIPFGVGTYASRNAVVAGNAALVAARQVRDKALALAAQLLETAADDLELVDGGVAGARRALVDGSRWASSPSAAAPGRPLPGGHGARAWRRRTTSWRRGRRSPAACTWPSSRSTATRSRSRSSTTPS